MTDTILEPAQLQVCEAGLSKALVALLQEGSLQPAGDNDQALNLINNIFELLVSQSMHTHNPFSFISSFVPS